MTDLFSKWKKVKAKGGHKLYKFLLSEKERELKECNDKKNEKRSKINKFRNEQGEELFNLFSNEEKINYIWIKLKGKKNQ